MKKQILAMALLSLVAVSCGEAEATHEESEAKHETVDPAVANEIKELDEKAAAFEKATTEINESKEALDELLNDL